MASEAKKIRIFEADSLTREEKIYAAKLKKSYKFTSQTPRYKFYFLRQFIFGVGIINLLLGKCELLAISMILSFLNSKEFVKLAACADPTLLKFFWYENSKVFEKFKRENSLLSQFSFYFPSKKRLLSLQNGRDLLREYYVFRKPKLDWKIDIYPNVYVSCLSFNPVHPILAFIECGDINVIAYGGQERKQKGQIMYATRRMGESRYYGINWSPSGEYLLALRGKETTTISFLWYDAKEFSISEVSTFPYENFEMCSGLNTKHLWVDESTVMFASAQRYVMSVIKINGKEREMNFNHVNLGKTMINLDAAVTDRTFKHIVSNFFVLPNPNSNFFYFVVLCAKPGHQHHRIIYVDKITLEIVKWVNLPGETVEISVSSERFYIIVQERKEESYMHNQPFLFSVITDLVTDFSECTFSEAWKGKSTAPHTNMANVKIIVCDENSVANFHQRCNPGHKLGYVYYNLTHDSNKVYSKIKETLFEVSSSNSLYVTNDYLYYTKDNSRETQVYGLHHEFKYHVKETWFHPSIPIFFQKFDPYKHIFYLNEKLASEEEKMKFKSAKYFEYKSKSYFSLTGPTHAN